MRLKAPLALALIAAAGAALAKPVKAPVNNDPAPNGYDGAWAFESTTVSGACPTLAPSNVRIEGNRVVAVNDGTMSPWGYVESDGTFVARLTDANGHVSRANGVLRATEGTGAWSSSTDLCGGAWRAYRVGR